MKKTITLEAIDPIEIYGVGNKILTEFCSYFPHLKVVARGNELILEGRESDIAEFNIRFAELIDRRHHKMNLTAYDVEDIFSGSGENTRPTADMVVVHGTDGKPIRARNKTQQDLVKAYFENDLIFAIGPAGTGKTYMAIASSPAPPWKPESAWAFCPETSRTSWTRISSPCTTPSRT